jgi:uncharacterized membrane protein YeaQ/YmgE (transglycosylase-associated protein family)
MALILAALTLPLDPGGWIAWIFVGLIAGFLASLVIRGRGYGCLRNIIVGLIGAVIGGIIVSQLNLGTFRFWGSVLVAFLGACILVIILQAFSFSRGRDRREKY